MFPNSDEAQESEILSNIFACYQLGKIFLNPPERREFPEDAKHDLFLFLGRTSRSVLFFGF